MLHFIRKTVIWFGLKRFYMKRDTGIKWVNRWIQPKFSSGVLNHSNINQKEMFLLHFLYINCLVSVFANVSEIVNIRNKRRCSWGSLPEFHQSCPTLEISCEYFIEYPAKMFVILTLKYRWSLESFNWEWIWLIQTISRLNYISSIYFSKIILE